MKKSKIGIIIAILFYILSGTLTGCFLSGDKNINLSHEITDYLKIVDADSNVQKLYDEVWRDSEQVTVCISDEKITEITLKEIEDESDLEWTLYGLHPGMRMEDVQNALNVPGIVMERHNMQWYATGLELERNGIQRLCWDPNDTITYVSALIDTEMIVELRDYELAVQEQEYFFCDESRNVNIVIHYPLIEISGHKESADAVNANIDSAMDRLLQNCDLAKAVNVSMKVDYSIRNAESECFSIEWVGNCTDEEHTHEVRTAMTCNMQEGGALLQLTDLGMTKEQLAGEIAWREDLNETEIYDQLIENYFDYYVTPLYIVVVCNNPNTGEQMVNSIWR